MTRERRWIINWLQYLLLSLSVVVCAMQVAAAAPADIPAKIVIVHNLDNPPLKYVDEQGRAAGLLIDIWRLWASKIGVDVEFRAAGWDETLRMMREGEADIHAGLFFSEERDGYLDYASSPLFDLKYNLFFHKKIIGLNRIEDLMGLQIGVPKGSTKQLIAERLPKAALAIFDSFPQLYEAARKDEIKAFISPPLNYHYYLNKRGESSNFRYRPDQVVYSPSYRGAVQEGKSELLTLVNQGLAQITPGEREAIERRWLIDSGIDSNASDSLAISEQPALKLTKEEQTWIAAHPEIRVSGEANWPPFEFRGQNEKWQGIGSDYLLLALERIGIKATMEIDKQWGEKLEMLRHGELDMAGSMSRSAERDTFLNFTKSYFDHPIVIVTRRSGDAIQSMDQLKGRIVAVEKGYVIEELIRQQFPEITLLQKKDTAAALDAVATEQADAYVGIRAVTAYVLERDQLLSLKIVATTTVFPLIKQHFGIRKDWPELATLMQKALDSISEEERRAIRYRWLGADADFDEPTRQINLTLEERAWLLEHPRIRLGLDPAWSPIEYVGDDGEHKGLTSEYIKIISRLLGIRMTPVPGLNWEQVLDAAREKEVDLLPALIKAPEREEYLEFTDPYMEFPTVVFVREHTPFIAGLEDLAGKRIAMEKSYISTARLEQDFPALIIVPVSNTKEALTMLSLGMVDAYVGNLIVGGYIISQEGLTNVKVAAPTPYRFNLHFGIRKDWPEFRTILQKVLDTLTEADRAEIRKKWLSIRYDVGVDYTLLWKVVGAASVIFLLGLLWLLQIRRQKDRLQASESQLQKILDAIPLSLVVTARDGRILLANPRVAVDMEVEEGSAIGRNITEFYADSSERDKVLGLLLSKGEMKDYPVRFRTNNDAIVEGLLSVMPIRMEEENAQLGILVNLTDRFRMERELAEAKETAEESSRFKSRFLANMSHEIRTPMNAIIGMSYLALQTELTAKQRDYVEKIEFSAHNLLGIINDILDFSKVEAGKLVIEETGFLLYDVLTNLGDMINLKAEEKGVEFLYKCDQSVPNGLVGDPLRLGQILLNLVQNAIKFTEQGEVIVSVSLVELQHKHARIEFSVDDTGIGIEQDKLSHLFEAFVQADDSTRRRYGGTGLGLSICKQLVELMGGKISAESKPGGGSRFSFTLNLGLQSDYTGSQFELTPDLRGLRVLLVDDNPAAQSVLCEMLNAFSFEVTIASSAREAYDYLQTADSGQTAEPNPYELVLMDWRMAKVNGIEAVRYIRQQLGLAKNPHIILVTAHGHDEVLHQAKQLDLDGFLVKPVTPSTLFDTIVSVFHGEKSNHHSKQIKQPPTHLLKGKILLVEDNRINQQVAQELLESFGLLAVIAEDGEDAVQQVQEADYDLVLMDIQMPGMDGFEATRMIRLMPELAGLPIIAMTAHAMEGDREKCLSAGMSDYLSKPINPEHLMQLLQQWLEGRVQPFEKQMTDRSDSMLELPENLKQIDLEWGLKRVGGNRALYVKLLSDFYHRYKDSCARMEEQLQNTSLEDARRLAHTVQGVAGNLGARRLQASAEKLEQSIKQRERTHFSSLQERFCDEAKAVFTELSVAMADWDRQEQRNTPESGVEVSNFPPIKDVFMLKQFANLLREGDPDAADCMDDLQRLIGEDPKTIDLNRHLKQQISDYAFDEALITLQKISKRLCIPSMEHDVDE